MKIHHKVEARCSLEDGMEIIEKHIEIAIEGCFYGFIAEQYADRLSKAAVDIRWLVSRCKQEKLK